MIPKVIHYCWFGGNPLPPLAVKCIESWKKYCPEYEIKEWNESNFDLNCCNYVKEAYETKKWAFVTDYVRLYIMVHEGGIYMDTDVEVIAPLDNFLVNRAFSGFENATEIPTGIMACEKDFPLFIELLHDYDNRHFKQDDGTLDMSTNVKIITKLCRKYGFISNNQKQQIQGLVLYPNDVFCPKSYDTGEIHLTDKTVTIHHFAGSWISTAGKVSNYIKTKTQNKGILLRSIGIFVAAPFTITDRIKKTGISKTIQYFGNKLIHYKSN